MDPRQVRQLAKELTVDGPQRQDILRMKKHEKWQRLWCKKPSDQKAVMSRAQKGRFIRWDWHQQKYVWVSKEDLRAKAAKKDKPLKPSPYLQNCDINRKSNRPSAVRVPPRRGCKRPLKVYQKKEKQLPEAKKKRVVKWKSAVSSSRKEQPKRSTRATKNQRAKKPVKKSAKRSPKTPAATNTNMADAGNRGGCDDVDTANPSLELLQGHDTFMNVVTNRLIHQGAALTFWRQSPTALVSYLVRTNDNAVTVDILPVMIESFSEMSKGKRNAHLFMGACVDLLPTLRKLLDARFEDYIKTSLDFLRTMIRFYMKDLEAMKAAGTISNLQKSQSVYGMYMAIVAMTDKLQRLAKRQGDVGHKAAIVAELVEKL